MAAKTGTVTGTRLDHQGQPVPGRYTFQPEVDGPVLDAAGKVVLSTEPVVVELDDTGQFSVQLVATDDPGLNPTGFTYLVQPLVAGHRERAYSISVPADAPVDVATVTPTAASHGVASVTLPTLPELAGTVTDAQLPARLSAATLQAGLDAKADATATTQALAAKADAAALAAKADASALAAKADEASVASRLAAKADATATTQALAAKADATATTQALAGKATPADVDAKIVAERTVSNSTYEQHLLPSGVSGNTRNNDPRLSVYGMTAANTAKTRAALGRARAGVGLGHILCAGDSTTAGSVGVSPSTQAWPVYFRNAFESRGYPLSGGGYVFANNSEGTQRTSDTRWSFVGTWASGSGIYAGATSAGATATFTSDKAGTIVELVYLDRSSYGGFTYAIDGGAAVPVTMSASSSTSVKKITVTGLADTTHTLVITTGSATVTFVVAACVRKATGLMVTNGGDGSARTSHFASASAATVGQITSGLTPAPDSVFLSLLINDASDAIAIATYKANLTTAINYYTSKGAEVILLTAPPSNTAVISTAVWNTYRQALYDLSDTLGVPLIDLTDRLISFTAASAAGLTFDDKHPNAAGYALIASAVVAAIGA